jgi:SAM-dependent methyltransferase
MSVKGHAGPEGLIPSTSRFGTALADIVRCQRCGHMQLERFPAETDLAAAYERSESRAYLEEEVGQRATAHVVLDALERHHARGSLLDVGSWVGFLLAEAGARGWRAQGVEPSEFACTYARETLALDVQRADLFTAELPAGAFDAVVLGDVIEHLPRPSHALTRVHRLLAGDGILCLTLPDAGSFCARLLGRHWWSVIPTHVQYFTRASIRRLLESHGFAVVEVGTAPKAFTVGYYLGRLGGYSPSIGRGVVRAAQRLSLVDRVWAPDFRDRMLIIARRTANASRP